MDNLNYVLTIPFLFLSAYIFLRFFYLKQKEKEPLRKVILAIVLGGLSVAIAFYSEALFAYLIGLPRDLKIQDIASKEYLVFLVIIMLLFVGFIEELLKLLAALPIYFTRDFNRVRDGLFYMALAGLGFGLVEDFVYVGRVGFFGVMLRLIFGILFHPAASGIIGYYIGRARFKLSSWWKVFFVLLGVMLLHGLYDISIIFHVGILEPFATAIAVLLYGLIFILYNKSEKQDREMGLETSSVYKFCPRCGQANSNRDFCTRCGKKLFID